MEALFIVLKGLSSLSIMCATVLVMGFVSLRYEKRMTDNHSNDL